MAPDDQDVADFLEEMAFVPSGGETFEDDCFRILVRPIEDCQSYSKAEMPQTDILLSWFGLDGELVLRAKRAGGLVTSVYRQLGIGCERLVRHVIEKNLGVSQSVAWGHNVDGQDRTLDAKIILEQMTARRPVVEAWLTEAARRTNLDVPLKGGVFEVRQGHKSGDSKRQVADRLNARQARLEGLVPILLVFSTQLPKGAWARYEREGWVVILGRVSGDTFQSTFAFMREVLGFDLAALLESRQAELKALVRKIFETRMV